MSVILIAAAAENNALGKDNQMLWHLSDDFRRFKTMTTGHHIIMGRKTFESFPKPLPNRTHIIITRQHDFHPEGCIVVGSMAEAINAAPANEDVFVIGGGEIYNLAMPLADTIELTRVHSTFDADTFFPEISADDWRLESEEYHPKDEKHQFDFTFQTFIRK
jgi:dihydrofolate reductase